MKKIFLDRHTYLACILIFAAHFLVQAHARSKIDETRDKLTIINQKIQTLNSKLDKSDNKKLVINKELKVIEKKISTNIVKLNGIENSLKQTEGDITKQNEEISKLTKEYENLQDNLVQIILIRHKLGQNPPLKWLLSHEDATKTERLLTYYEYILKEEKKILTDIRLTKTQLDTKQEKLKIEEQKLRAYKITLKKEKKILTENKAYQSIILKELLKNIASSKLELQDLENDRNKLSELLLKLTHSSLKNIRSTFAHMKHKLSLPVQIDDKSIEKSSNGLMFYAPSGTEVKSIFQGKVVFSDWLKGYGLLIIIDHGDGYMSLYAHNQALFKHKGEYVEAQDCHFEKTVYTLR